MPRPEGYALSSVPLVWEYDRTVLEYRFTGPSLERLFAGWDEVAVLENGGRAVSWATLTALIASMAEYRVIRERPSSAMSTVFSVRSTRMPRRAMDSS